MIHCNKTSDTAAAATAAVKAAAAALMNMCNKFEFGQKVTLQGQDLGLSCKNGLLSMGGVGSV
jgi:hypothetical protein